MDDLYMPKKHTVRARRFTENTNDAGQAFADWINGFGPEYKAKVIPLYDTKSPNPNLVWVKFKQNGVGWFNVIWGKWVVYEFGEFTILSDELFKSGYDPVEEKEGAVQ